MRARPTGGDQNWSWKLLIFLCDHFVSLCRFFFFVNVLSLGLFFVVILFHFLVVFTMSLFCVTLWPFISFKLFCLPVLTFVSLCSCCHLVVIFAIFELIFIYLFIFFFTLLCGCFLSPSPCGNVCHYVGILCQFVFHIVSLQLFLHVNCWSFSKNFFKFFCLLSSVILFHFFVTLWSFVCLAVVLCLRDF